jgi:hypothetical protein
VVSGTISRLAGIAAACALALTATGCGAADDGIGHDAPETVDGPPGAPGSSPTGGDPANPANPAGESDPAGAPDAPCTFTPGTLPSSGAFLRPVDHCSFALTPNESFATYSSRIAGLEQNRQLAPVGLEGVLSAANRAIRPLCHDTFLLPGAGTPSGFCWESGDDDATNVWVPQGLTGSGDANPTGAVLGGRRVMLVTWHTGNRHPLGSDKLARISFVDLDTKKYLHVLLVEPVSDGDFKAVSSHADGLMWYGDKLLLAQGGYIRIFDLAHLWRMDPSGDAVGRGEDGKFRAGGHSFALPQVGWFRHPTSWTCSAITGDNNCFNGIALDRSGGRDSFVSVEFTSRASGGRVVRWPLDPTTQLPRISTDGLVHPIEAFSSPLWGMQGGVSYNGNFVLVGVCPEYAATTGVDMPSCLHVGRGGERTRSWTRAPKNSQNVSYWPATNELWVTNEQLRERVTFHITAPF